MRNVFTGPALQDKIPILDFHFDWSWRGQSFSTELLSEILILFLKQM